MGRKDHLVWLMLIMHKWDGELPRSEGLTSESVCKGVSRET